jgi:hypothetical protein
MSRFRRGWLWRLRCWILRRPYPKCPKCKPLYWYGGQFLDENGRWDSRSVHWHDCPNIHRNEAPPGMVS